MKPTAERTSVPSIYRRASQPQEVLNALAGLDIDDARVELIGGRLYLRGQAACYKTKQLAGQRAADAMPGLAVVNELRIAQGVSSDADVTHAVEEAIRRAVPAATGRISAHVDSGDAYIGGIAADEAERSAIEKAAWEAPGVLQVHNQVSVPRLAESDLELAANLTLYIHHSVTLPHGDILVRYNRGVVSLDGEVATAQQREAVEELVRWHECVTDVVNNVRVAPLRPVR
ncbi:MAG TPA: BON domain-containing protein [Dehalococcoidia bacterium]|jgi:osmotically-inducible protein OsmY